MLRARGNIDRMIDDTARHWSAQYTPEELVAQLRETAGSPRRPPGTTVDDPLVDVLVHGQDIARPLDRSRVISAACGSSPRTWPGRPGTGPRCAGPPATSCWSPRAGPRA